MIAVEMRDIVGYEKVYAITLDGQIWSYPRKNKRGRPGKGQWIKQRIGFGGYLSVSLRKPGERSATTFYVHRLVLIHFKGIPDIIINQANHVDGIKTHNTIENLEWTTSSGNRKHAWKMGLIKQTEGRMQAGIKRGLKLRKLSEDQAINVKKLILSGITKTDVATMYNVSRKTISNYIKENSNA